MAGKESDLWDDSALVDAFNHAISTYKFQRMHGKKVSDVPNDKGDVGGRSGDQPDCNVDDKEVQRQDDVDDKSNLQSNVATEVGESSNPSAYQENRHIDPHVPDSYTEVAGDGQKSSAYSQGSQDYNQLLNQYYELEQKRQQIVDQLNQYGYWNYQYGNDAYGSGMQCTNAPTFQEHPLPVGQASNQTTLPSCCPCVSQCVAAPCNSVPTCCFAGPCIDTRGPMDQRKSIPQEDSNIVETAMGAAERAISSLGMKISGNSNVSEGNKEKVNDRENGAAIHSASSETDLTEVLNAWYSAGFYTGKYLVEQSIAKKRQN